MESRKEGEGDRGRFQISEDISQSPDMPCLPGQRPKLRSAQIPPSNFRMKPHFVPRGSGRDQEEGLRAMHREGGPIVYKDRKHCTLREILSSKKWSCGQFLKFLCVYPFICCIGFLPPSRFVSHLARLPITSNQT